jgi:hypothetical protein
MYVVLGYPIVKDEVNDKKRLRRWRVGSVRRHARVELAVEDEYQ